MKIGFVLDGDIMQEYDSKLVVILLVLLVFYSIAVFNCWLPFFNLNNFWEISGERSFVCICSLSGV